MHLEDLIKRVDQLIGQANDLLKGVPEDGDYYSINTESYHKFRSSALSFLASTFGKKHDYYVEFNKIENSSSSYYAMQSRGIISAVRDEMAGGWLVTTKGLVSAEIFADFLGMAGYLLSENYKDAAAVMIGSVLEEHLRQLCQKHGIPMEFTHNGDLKPKKADVLNADLAKADVYNKLDQKSVTTWLGLRNSAAHGLYGDYTKEQVALMLQGVTDFMTRNSV